MSYMSNAVETIELEDGLVYFDHGTGDMWAEWNNGYSEKWSNIGRDVSECLISFYVFTGQNEKLGWA